MVSMHSQMPIYAPPRLSEVSPTLSLKRSQCFVWLTMTLSRPFKEDRLVIASFIAFSSRRSYSLALCPQVASQPSQHFRYSEKQATCEGCFARQSVYHHSGISWQYTQRIFQGGCRPSTHCSLGFPFHFL